MTAVLDEIGTLTRITSAVTRGFVDTRHGGPPALPHGLPALPNGWTPVAGPQQAPAQPQHAQPGAPAGLLVLPVVRYDGFPAWMYLMGETADGQLRRRFSAELAGLDATLSGVCTDPAAAALLAWLDRSGPNDPAPFVVCARPGPTFADDRARGPIPAGQVLGALLTCIDAVSVLHRHGRIHGQLSPAAMHRAGAAARLSPPLPPVFAERVALAGGTGHEPPEVLGGAVPDAAADVFALASTAWTLLGGRAPYGAREDNLARLVAREPAALPRSDLPDGLDAALRSALNPEPARRADLPTLRQALLIAAQHSDGDVITAGHAVRSAVPVGAPPADPRSADPRSADPRSAVDPEATIRRPRHRRAEPDAPAAGRERLDTLAPSRAPARAVEEAGQPLGSRYLLDSLIGRGATGHVWRGHVRGTSARIAVKLIRPELAEDPEVVTRFMRERATLMRVQHANLVAVQDLVAEGGALAIVMDLVDGEDLRRALTRGPLQSTDAARVLAQTIAALSAVHAAGIVHRDLKPENILLDRTGARLQARLTDFGLARAVDSAVLTRGSQLIGTPAYVAPEIVAGRPATPAADVYAFGITAYETLSGRRPFLAESTAALLRAHLDEAPLRPSGLDEDVWALIASCLHKDPAARPDAASLAVAWWRLAADEPARLAADEPAPRPAAAAPALATAEPVAPADVHVGFPALATAEPVAPVDENAATPVRYPRPAMVATGVGDVIGVGDTAGVQETIGAQRPLAATPPLPHAAHTRWRAPTLVAAAVIVVGFGAGFGVAALRDGGSHSVGGTQPVGTAPGGTTATSPSQSIGYPLSAQIVVTGGFPYVKWTVPAGLAGSDSVVVVSRAGSNVPLLPTSLKPSQHLQVEPDLEPGDCVVVDLYLPAKTPAQPAKPPPPACVPATSPSKNPGSTTPKSPASKAKSSASTSKSPTSQGESG